MSEDSEGPEAENSFKGQCLCNVRTGKGVTWKNGVLRVVLISAPNGEEEGEEVKNYGIRHRHPGPDQP